MRTTRKKSFVTCANADSLVPKRVEKDKAKVSRGRKVVVKEEKEEKEKMDGTVMSAETITLATERFATCVTAENRSRKKTANAQEKTIGFALVAAMSTTPEERFAICDRASNPNLKRKPLRPSVSRRRQACGIALNVATRTT